MPFIANTPESLLARSDSLDPSRTCHGITSAGLPCRRALASSASASPGSESSFCWQHKEQSAASTPASTPLKGGKNGGGGGGGVVGRSSIDTLAERLGLASLEEKRKTGRKDTGKSVKSGKPGKGGSGGGGFLRCCFCFHVPIEEVPRPQPRPVQKPTRPEKTASTPARPTHATPTKPKPHSSPAKLSPSAHRPSSSRPSNGHLSPAPLELIHPSTDPQTASLLLAELARGHVESEEPGYIYMFWMTPPSRLSPPGDAARALLSSGRGSGAGGRTSSRNSDVVGDFAARGAGDKGGKDKGGKGKGPMLLKIGRASNVQRRMNEWSRQCDYEIEVLRFYPYSPYHSSSSSSSSAQAPKPPPSMTPHVKKVERLIHIELAGMGLRADRGACEVCGREHREWFEVEGSRTGVGRVDEVIRRWVEWDEGLGEG